MTGSVNSGLGDNRHGFGVLLGPCGQSSERRLKRIAERSEAVLNPGWHFGIHGSRDQTPELKLAKGAREFLLGHPTNASSKFAKANRALCAMQMKEDR
jgi:hypothetical protein